MKRKLEMLGRGNTVENRTVHKCEEKSLANVHMKDLYECKVKIEWLKEINNMEKLKGAIEYLKLYGNVA